MGFYRGPDIVRDGLEFALDAGSPRCFTSGNTTATDLIQGFNCSGASGTPGGGTHTPDTANFPAYSAINGGVFNFAGGRGINIDGDLGGHTISSICVWFYKTNSSNEYFFDGRNDGGDWFLANYSSYNINWEHQLGYNYDATYNPSTANFLNQWIHMVATSEDTGSKLYLNGNEVSTSSNSVDEDFGKNYRIGTRYTTSNSWTGYMGPIYFYNRAMTASEVAQNFNAQKLRFGL
jgi:hypothetical protein